MTDVQALRSQFRDRHGTIPVNQEDRVRDATLHCAVVFISVMEMPLAGQHGAVAVVDDAQADCG